eukprot:jgi/Galph1/231/GphlegSOOS_G4990.1
MAIAHRLNSLKALSSGLKLRKLITWDTQADIKPLVCLSIRNNSDAKQNAAIGNIMASLEESSLKASCWKQRSYLHTWQRTKETKKLLNPSTQQKRWFFLRPRNDDYVHFGGRRETFLDKLLKPKGLVIFGVVFGGAAIYYYVHIDYAPYTGRRRMIDLTRNQEISLGTQQFRKILSMEAHHVVPNSHPLSVRILRIGQRLAKVANQKDFRWEFVLVDKPVANAFCLPGGKVVVYTGLLPITPTDDALATVLAHEIGHAVARHGAEKLAFMKVLFLLQFIINIFVNTHALNSFMINILANLPFSRKLETEADYIGLQLMVKACYDPREAPHVFERLSKKNVHSPPEYLSTHPADKHRVERLQSWLPEVLPEYEANCPLKRSRKTRLDDFSSWFGR